jgi:hypothetical protein
MAQRDSFKSGEDGAVGNLHIVAQSFSPADRWDTPSLSDAPNATRTPRPANN